MGTIDKLDQGLEDVAGLVELAIEAEDEDTFHEAQAELAELETQLAKLEFRRMFSGKSDPKRIVTWIFNPALVVLKSGLGQHVNADVSALG